MLGPAEQRMFSASGGPSQPVNISTHTPTWEAMACRALQSATDRRTAIGRQGTLTLRCGARSIPVSTCTHAPCLCDLARALSMGTGHLWHCFLVASARFRSFI